MIARKLDFLMRLTNTSNSSLGRALCFDASYIGRIRAGKRGLPKNQPFIEPAAAYLIRSLREPYQRQAAAEAVCPGRPWPEDAQEAEALLASWLTRDDRISEGPVAQLLTRLSAAPVPFPAHQPPQPSAGCETGFYYGNSGKRGAVEAFLDELCALDAPQTLLLYSDEDMSWLYEDAAFARRWASRLAQLISKGGRIKIIHTVSRGIGEMLEAVQKWLPLYTGGAIEPYFYPKLRDGVYHRTLFLARGRSALISDSVKSHTQAALNLLIRDANAVAALETEFMDYLALCKPLMRIYGLQNSDAFAERLAAFEAAPGNLIAALSAPSHFTMPECTAKSLSSRAGSRAFLRARRRSGEQFARNLAQGSTVTEILNLPAPEAVRAGAVPVPMCDLFGLPALCYTAAEFRAHTEHMITLLRTQENYCAVVSEQAVRDVALLVKEDAGVLLARSVPPSTVFGITEQSMTAAFGEYLERLAGRLPPKEKTIAKLTHYLERLG